jgi:hypothetical protein
MLAAALIPMPVAASDAGPVHTTATTAKAVSLHQAVVREAARAAAEAPLAKMSAPTQQRRSDQSSGNGATSFFKSRPGMIALTIMAVGTGYVIYSTQHDKITSPGRK